MDQRQGSLMAYEHRIICIELQVLLTFCKTLNMSIVFGNCVIWSSYCGLYGSLLLSNNCNYNYARITISYKPFGHGTINWKCRDPVRMS